MNRSSKFNFFLPQNTDPIDVSDFNSNFETIDANLLTKAQSLSSEQKAAVRANVDLNVANNLTTTAAGSVLDARQGKVLGDKVGGFREFSYTISANSDAACVSSALADIMTQMTEGSFLARVMRSGSWLLECCGAVRNGYAFAQCFNTYNGNIYVFSKQSGHDIQTLYNAKEFSAVVFTPSTGITNDLFIRRYGRVVIINGYLTGSSAFGQSQLLGTIENGSRPITTVRTLASVANAAYSIGDIAYVSIDSNGEVRITTKSGNAYKSCYFSVSYIVQS